MGTHSRTHHADLAPTPSATPLAPTDAPMDCSLAVFSARGECNYDAVVSLGQGDVRVLRVQGGAATAATDAVQAVGSPPPLAAAARALTVEAAYVAPTGAVARTRSGQRVRFSLLCPTALSAPLSPLPTSSAAQPHTPLHPCRPAAVYSMGHPPQGRPPRGCV